MLDKHLKKRIGLWMLVIFISWTAGMKHIEFVQDESTVHADYKKDLDAPSTKQDVKGIYLNRNSIKEENIQDYIDLVKDTDLNAVVMDVKDDAGKLTYHSDVDVAKEIHSDEEATVKDMQALLKRLKKEGIYSSLTPKNVKNTVIPMFLTFF